MKRAAFVLMPFKQPFDLYYESIITPALEQAGYAVSRADDVFTPRPIMTDINKSIIEADLVLGEMSGQNPNVFYELGLAHAIGKPAILIAGDRNDIPFDLRHIRAIVYDRNAPDWGAALSGSIVAAARSLDDEGNVWPPPLAAQTTVAELTDRYESSGADVRRAILNAEGKIWILQTWLPGIGGDARMLLDSRAQELKIILGSFAPDSPIRARIKTRRDLILRSEARGLPEMQQELLETAKRNSAMSAVLFKDEGRRECVKFTAYHHPGWIARVDNFVFWGATPLEKDNWNVPAVCYKAHVQERRAAHWLAEFNLLWSGRDPITSAPLSHSYDDEAAFNTLLSK